MGEGVWMARIEDAVRRKSRAEKRHVSRRSRAEVRGLVRAERTGEQNNCNEKGFFFFFYNDWKRLRRKKKKKWFWLCWGRSEECRTAPRSPARMVVRDWS